MASALALVVATQAGIGAPPSEFAPRDSWWWTLDPSMFPALFGGVILSLIALVTSVLATRAAAVLCVLASLSTAVGVIIAAGTSDHPSIGFYSVCLIFVATPALISMTAFRR